MNDNMKLPAWESNRSGHRLRCTIFVDLLKGMAEYLVRRRATGNGQTAANSYQLDGESEIYSIRSTHAQFEIVNANVCSTSWRGAGYGGLVP
jgi:hypothetical protein